MLLIQRKDLQKDYNNEDYDLFVELKAQQDYYVVEHNHAYWHSHGVEQLSVFKTLKEAKEAYNKVERLLNKQKASWIYLGQQQLKRWWDRELTAQEHQEILVELEVRDKIDLVDIVYDPILYKNKLTPIGRKTTTYNYLNYKIVVKEYDDCCTSNDQKYIQIYTPKEVDFFEERVDDDNLSKLYEIVGANHMTVTCLLNDKIIAKHSYDYQDYDNELPFTYKAVVKIIMQLN